MSSIDVAADITKDRSHIDELKSAFDADDPAAAEQVNKTGETTQQELWLKDILAGIYLNPESKPKLDESHDEQLGMSGSVKKLYEGPSKCACCINWVEEYPDNLKESIESTSEAKEHALLVRVKWDHEYQRPTTIDSIVIQSPLLKSFLRSLLDGYPGISPKLDILVFEAPFRCFFHR